MLVAKFVLVMGVESVTMRNFPGVMVEDIDAVLYQMVLFVVEIPALVEARSRVAFEQLP